MEGVWEALKKTLISSSSIMLIVGFTTIFTWVLTMQKVPQTVGAFFMSPEHARMGHCTDL